MYSGFYVNLARSYSRREALTRHLAAIGAAGRYQRVEAVDGQAVAAAYATSLDPGALGVWLSHEQVIQNYRDPDRHLHIIDDDVTFASNAIPVLDQLLRYADAQGGAWDLIFTEIMVPPSLDVFRLLYKTLLVYESSAEYSLLDLANISFCGSTSVLVNKTSVRKYADLVSGQWRGGLPIDLHIRNLVQQRQLKAFVTVPFLTTISAQGVQSDIRGDLDQSRRVYDVLRRAFFQEADREALFAEMERLTHGVSPPLMADLFLKVVAFSLSDRWQRF